MPNEKSETDDDPVVSPPASGEVHASTDPEPARAAASEATTTDRRNGKTAVAEHDDAIVGRDDIDRGEPGADAAGATPQGGSSPNAADRPRRRWTPARDHPAEKATRARRQVSLSARALISGLLAIALVAALAVFVYRDLSARNDLEELRTDNADRGTAERVAGEYAVNAATLDYNDLTPWIANMKKGVSPDLSKQYDLIGQTMEQVLTPLRMQTTAHLVVAKVSNVSGNIYRVQAVVDVDTTTVQTPNGGSTDATYELTLDKAHNWMITSVGDPTSAIPQQLGPAGNTPASPESAPPSPPQGG